MIFKNRLIFLNGSTWARSDAVLAGSLTGSFPEELGKG